MESERGQSNTLFIIIAAGLIGLICIGMVGLIGVLSMNRLNSAQEIAALQPTPIDTPFPPTFTPSPTLTSTPTETPEPTPTGTPVIKVGGETEGEELSEQVGAGTTIPALNVTVTSTSVLGNGDATELTPTPIIIEMTPTPIIIPGSGGVLPVATNSILVWLGGGVLLVLVVFGLFNRGKASS